MVFACFWCIMKVTSCHISSRRSMQRSAYIMRVAKQITCGKSDAFLTRMPCHLLWLQLFVIKAPLLDVFTPAWLLCKWWDWKKITKQKETESNQRGLLVVWIFFFWQIKTAMQDVHYKMTDKAKMFQKIHVTQEPFFPALKVLIWVG